MSLSQQNNANCRTLSLEADLKLSPDLFYLMNRWELREITQCKALLNAAKSIEVMEEETSKSCQDENLIIVIQPMMIMWLWRKKKKHHSSWKWGTTFKLRVDFMNWVMIYPTLFLLLFVTSNSISNMISNSFCDHNLPSITKCELPCTHNTRNIVFIFHRKKLQLENEFWRKRRKKK